MTAEVFLDANILLYACSKAPNDGDKSRRAKHLVLSTPFALSAQVLQEFIAVGRRDNRGGFVRDKMWN